MDFKALVVRAIGPNGNFDRYLVLRQEPICRGSYESAYDRYLKVTKEDKGWFGEATVRKQFCDDIRAAKPALERLEKGIWPEPWDLEKLEKFFVPGSDQHRAFTEDFNSFIKPDGIRRMKEFSENALSEEHEFLNNSISALFNAQARGESTTLHEYILKSRLGYPQVDMWVQEDPGLAIQEHMEKNPRENWPFLPPSPTSESYLACRDNYFGTKSPKSTLLHSIDNFSPLDQFDISDFFSLDLPDLVYSHMSITNIAIYLTIAVISFYVLNLLVRNYKKFVAVVWSISWESIYYTLSGIVLNQINSNKGHTYFPFIYTLFIFIIANNLMGMIPFSFAATSHFILAFFLSFTVVFAATTLGLRKFALGFFSFFVPGGCPLGLLPLLVLIEFISYLARNVSLGLRLAANVLSGHMLLNILSGFAHNIVNTGLIYLLIGLIPLAFIISFSGLELGIAFIQAQVFVVLTSSYIKDVLVLH